MNFLYTILIMALALTIDCPGQATNPNEPADKLRQLYVGTLIKVAISADLKQIEHFLIGSKSGVEIPLEYGIRRIHAGNHEMLWLERANDFDSRGGVESWKVLDVLLLPTLESKQILITQYCFVRMEYEPEIIAVFSLQEREYLKDAAQAWRANRLNGVFEQISVKDVRCENPEWNIP